MRKLALLSPVLFTLACNDSPTEATGSGTETSGETSIDPTASSNSADTSTGSVSATQGTVSNTGNTSATDSTSTADTSDTSATATDSSSETTASGTSSSSGGESSSSGGDTDTGGLIPCDDDTMCDDLLPCNGVETCDMGFCAGGIAIVCDDGVDCSVDACDDLNGGVCIVVPDDEACSDGLYCTGVETCDAVAGCQDGLDISCGDDVDCTNDSCDEDADGCAFAADPTSCQDGSFCNGPESCDLVQGCIDAPDPVDCDDLITCTEDSCNDQTEQCDNVPDDVPCDNGVFCDGAETCMVGMGCVDDAPVACASDNVACTVDACNENIDACESTPNNGACGGGQFCTPDGCIAGDVCNVANGVLNNPSCDDGLACNGEEVCFDLVGNQDQCQPGNPIVCGDNFNCTADSCVEPGNCQFVPNNGVCNDGNPCNGNETCNVATGCVNGQQLNCNDNIACTIDQCVPGFGCTNGEADAECDDNVFCNGVEICDAQAGGCQSGPNVVCPSDGIACTAESCNEVNDTCVATTNDDLCPCGQTCEISAGGCDASCSPALCEGQIYDCGDCIDNDADCDVDDEDSNCFGPCSDNEAGLAGGIPGQDNAPCKHDCYFDNDSGTGNDDCFWSHECDPLEPSFSTCEYDPNANVPGSGLDCAELEVMQSAECISVCGPLTPNGCDCFGCCTVDLPGLGLTEIFLGSAENGNGNETCSVEVFDQPNVLDLCHPCTQVPACLNTCEPCELCFNQDELPPECNDVQDCGLDGIPCGLPGQADCPGGGFCLTGCCVQG